MDDREISRRLKGFEAVWKRAGASRPAGRDGKTPAGPERKRPAAGQRYNPRRG